jgi:hypothetical protein
VDECGYVGNLSFTGPVEPSYPNKNVATASGARKRTIVEVLDRTAARTYVPTSKAQGAEAAGHTVRGSAGC